MTAAINAPTRKRWFTAEELLELNGMSRRFELVAGELREMSPAGFHHGAIVQRLSGILWEFVTRNDLGVVLGAETGFILARSPDTVRGPDVGFVSKERIKRIGIPVAFFPEAPDLAVEVVSPGDRPTEVEDKSRDWIAGGVKLLWVVDPKPRTVTVYQLGSNPHILSEHDTLNGEAVLPGFAIKIADLFQPFV